MTKKVLSICFYDYLISPRVKEESQLRKIYFLDIMRLNSTNYLDMPCSFFLMRLNRPTNLLEILLIQYVRLCSNNHMRGLLSNTLFRQEDRVDKDK